jgi:hypothetical protein
MFYTVGYAIVLRPYLDRLESCLGLFEKAIFTHRRMSSDFFSYWDWENYCLAVFSLFFIPL